jgi:molybdenum cofactor guanylyltransferase
VRTGIVLAGGRSARFGGDKLRATLDGKALLDRAIDAVREVADEVIVAGSNIAAPSIAASSTRVRWIQDAEPFGGPLIGLAGALDAARGSTAVVVGGDMPRVVPAVLRAMLDRRDAEPLVEAVILGRPAQDVASDRPRAVLPMAVDVERARSAAGAALDGGSRSLRSLLDDLATVELPAEAWLPLDPNAATLLDVDTSSDLDRIRARAAD